MGKVENKMGLHGVHTSEIVFTDMIVPKENLLGQEGKGFKICMQTLDVGRIGIAAQALGIAEGAMKEAVEEGVDLMGYTMWSCIDLVSASSGELRKRYGFVYVDAHDDGTGTFKRYRKDSFWWYKKVIESNGEDLG